MLVSPVFARFLRAAASGDRVASSWATRSGAGSSVVALLRRSFASLLASLDVFCRLGTSRSPCVGVKVIGRRLCRFVGTVPERSR